MTCNATTPAATPPALSAFDSLQGISPSGERSRSSAPSGPVERIVNGPNSDGETGSRIVSRAAKLRFPNAIQRARYESVHRTLGRGI